MDGMPESRGSNEATDIDWKEYQIHEEDGRRDARCDAGDAHADEGEESILYITHNLFRSQEDEEAGSDFYEVCEYDVKSTGEKHLPATLRLRHHAETANSTGLGVWSGAELLANYLMQHPHLVQYKRVVEIGAGTGLVGLTAHHLGASHVTMTDGDSVVLRNLRFNVANNVADDFMCRGGVECIQLIWGSHNASEFLSTCSYPAERSGQEQKRLSPVQVVLASDCIYMVPSLVPFWETVSRLLSGSSSLRGCDSRKTNEKDEHTTAVGPTHSDKKISDGCGSGIVIFANLCASQAPLDMILQTASRFSFTWTSHVNEQIFIFKKCNRS